MTSELYKKNGFLIVENLFTLDDIEKLKHETLDIFSGKRGLIEGLLPENNYKDNTESEILSKYLCMHFPHKFSNMIKDYMSHSSIVDILTQIISPNVKAVQSMLFVKAPGKPGQSWHQDEYYIPTRDCSLTGVWIALDDATIENGCLWIIPASHKPSKIYKRVEYKGSEYGEHDTIDTSEFDLSKAVPVTLKAGSVLFFNGYLLHSSKRNKTHNRFRRALVYHYMSAESYLPWDQDGKLPLREDMRDIVMVAGKDPYKYKGVEDVNKPYLRPDFQKIIKM